MFIAPSKPSELWAMDSVFDSFVSGRRFRVLTVKELFTHETVLRRVDLSISGSWLLERWSRLKQHEALPKAIICDNGSEFISNAMVQRSFVNGVELRFIQSGKPIQNAFIESYNGKFRRECLDQNWLYIMTDARKTIAEWRNDYNVDGPNKPLGKETPSEFARRHRMFV